MKRFILLLALLFGYSASAQISNTITTEIIVTNKPATGFNFTFNGSFRYWTNARTATTIDTNAVTDVNTAATNLYSQISLNPYINTTYGTFRITRGNTNSIKLLGPVGLVPSISQNSNWITWIFTTNLTQPGTNIAVPAARVWPSASDRTNIIGQLQSDIVNFGSAGAGYPTNDNRLAAYLGRGNYPQNATGALTLFKFSGTNNGTIYNGSYSNPTNIGGVSTNHEIRGDLINYYAGNTNGSGINFGQHHLIAGSSGNANLIQANGEPAEPNDPGDIITFYWLYILMPAIGTGTNQWHSYNQWFGSNNFQGGFLATNVLAYTLNAYGGYLSNLFAQSLIASNAVHAGTNQWTGDVAWVNGTYSTMLNTNNTVPSFTNAVVYLSGSTLQHDIAGVAGGRPGKRQRFWDSGTLPLIIRNLSGGTAAGNAIRTRTGNDITLTNSPAGFDLEYSATANEWLYCPLGN